MPVTHKFVNAKPDDADPTITRPSNWNDTHATPSIELDGTAAGTLLVKPTSNPAAGTELVQVTNAAGTRQIALTSDGKVKFADGSTQNTAPVFTVPAPLLEVQGANIASATPALSAATGNYVQITGTTTITSFGTVAAGARFVLFFASALKVTYNATSLILDGGTDYYAQAGDKLVLRSEGGGNWREVSRSYALAAARYVTANLGAPVTMTNANQYYDGPSISVGAGVWMVSGAVNINCPTNAHALVAKLWDGTNTALASAEQYMLTTGAQGNYAINLAPTVVVLTATTTLKISCQSPAAGQIIKITPANALSLEGNTSSRITAIRLF